MIKYSSKLGNLVTLVILSVYGPLTMARTLNTPLLFIHGFNSSAQDWEDDVTPWLQNDMLLKRGGVMKTTLTTEGAGIDYADIDTDGDFYFLQFANNVSGISDQVLQIKAAINYLIKHAAVRQLVLIGYSMGGLSARIYLLRYPDTHAVKRLVSVASPHQGTEFSSAFQLIRECKKSYISQLEGDVCQQINNIARVTLGFSLDNDALRDLQISQSVDSKNLISTYANKPHPESVEYAAIIGQSPKLFEADTVWMFLNELRTQQIEFLNALTSEPIDWLRNFLRLLRTGEEKYETGDGLISVQSQDLSQLPSFARTARLDHVSQNDRLVFKSYSFGWSGTMETFSLRDSYHLRTPENIEVLKRALSGIVNLRSAKLLDKHSVLIELTGSLVSARGMSLLGKMKGKVTMITIKRITTQEKAVLLETEEDLSGFDEWIISYNNGSNAKNAKLSTIKLTISRRNNNAYLLAFILVLAIATISVFAYNAYSMSSKKTTEADGFEDWW